MHEVGFPVDLSVFTRLIATLFFLAVGVFYFLKNTAAKYFDIGAAAAGGFDREHMAVYTEDCSVCGKYSTKKCSRCKSVRYCSAECQKSDWDSGHQRKCKDFGITTITPSAKNGLRFRDSPFGNRSASKISLVADRGLSKRSLKPGEVLFPYEEFLRYFYWDNTELAPCGLMNCGNSCFANVILQCLSWTRPLVAYLLEKGHRRECMRNDWCFFCEFETHVERASQSRFPFSPINIISRLTNIGGTLGYGRQEDAHEFMRYAIDTMQSVCLDEFGGEKMVPPRSQETTLIQYIFGGLLQSEVQCTVCNHVSDQYENMMDLTVEIHGDAVCLEECLDQFTAREWLQGDNMYKCDRCSDYVKACKRLTIQRAPNILTIALKRFQVGISVMRLVLFVGRPKIYVMGNIQNTEIFRSIEHYPQAITLSSVLILHIDGPIYFANSSYLRDRIGRWIDEEEEKLITSGKNSLQYIILDMRTLILRSTFIKDFCGNWYRIDDSEIESVELEDVLSQRAYMLLYSRIHARSSSLCLSSEVQDEKKTDTLDTISCQKQLVESSMLGPIDSRSSSYETSEDPEREIESTSSLSSPSVVTSECSSEVERVDTLDSESNPSVDDSATDHQGDVANGNRDPEVIHQAVDSCLDPTPSTPLVCTKSKRPVRDMDIEMIDAQ